MYLEHFGLTEKPFEQTPDSRFLYTGEQHRYALASIWFGLAQRDPFVIVTGEIGSGKTTLLNAVLAEMDETMVVARLSHTRLSDTELLEMILVEFGLEPHGKGKVQLLRMLRRFVEEQAAAKRQVVILIDEAQNLSPDVLEELRLLTCIETEREKLVNVVLLGQPELSERLDSPQLEQLRQRCRLNIHIDELTQEETAEYVRHRMAIAGGDFERAFAPGTEARIHGYTGGVPRLINMLCDTALTACLVEEHPQVTDDVLEEVAAELKWRERGHAGHGTAGADPDRARLRVSHRGKPVGEFVLAEIQNMIGRDAGCQVCVDSKFFSRRHAIITRDGQGWTIADLNSTNGTKLNGHRIRKERLHDGDVIAIGKHQLTFHAGDFARGSAGPGGTEADAVSGRNPYDTGWHRTVEEEADRPDAPARSVSKP